jgi:SAM-dependent methyltransferase
VNFLLRKQRITHSWRYLQQIEQIIICNINLGYIYIYSNGSESLSEQYAITDYPDFVPSHKKEEILKSRLLQYLIEAGQSNPEINADRLFSLEGGFVSRFNYFLPYLDENAMHHLLISGCVAGSELIIARKYGFQEIYGTEISEEYIEIARLRLASAKGFHVDLYDGLHTPYDNEQFTMVCSGHIIEHTESPIKYFRECMRILSRDGYFFLEFPDRYHKIELHTNLPSVDFLPSPLRQLALKFLSSKLSPFSPIKRSYYNEVLKTLKPISVWQIRLYLVLNGYFKARILHKYSPAPGYVRMLIKK